MPPIAPRYRLKLSRCAAPSIWLALPVCWALAGWQAAAAEGPRLPVETIMVDKAENDARLHLERVKALVADEQWGEAIETLQRVMDDFGNKLLPLEEPADFRDAIYPRYQTVRQYCQQRLARFHTQAPDALALYRQQVDPLAERWYRQGVAERDPELLSRVVDQLFVSSFGDDALLALGEIALERGDFISARWHWERISPRLRSATQRAHDLAPNVAEEANDIANVNADGAAHAAPAAEDFPRVSGRPLWLEHLRDPRLSPQALAGNARGDADWLAYPDTDLPLAVVRGRLALISILEPAPARAAYEIELLRNLHPNAQGTLAGQQVDLAAALSNMLSEAADWPAARPATDWLTFAGNSARNAQAAHLVDVAGKLWETDLGNLARQPRPVMLEGQFFVNPAQRSFTPLPEVEDPRELLSYYPTVVGDRLYIADQIRSPNDPVKLRQRIRAFQLANGKPAWPGGAEPGEIYYREILANEPHFGSPLGTPRFTLTIHQNILLARLGSTITHQPQDNVPARETSVLVALDLAKQGSLLEGFPLAPDDPSWAFEGTPLTDGRNLYVAMHRSESKPQSHVACYELATGKLRWRRFVCASQSLTRGRQQAITHTLLTLVDDTLFVSTNLGGVACLSAANGTIRWLTSYPRTNLDQLTAAGEPAPQRDLTPCIYYQGLILAAPADCPSLFALDAASGQMIWDTNPEDVMHLLGVGAGNLLASGDRLWWFDAYTGRTTGMFPTDENPNPRGFGRGMLAGEVVFWPTREQIHVLAQRTMRGLAQPVRQPIDLLRRQVATGNLLLIGDKMVITSADRLQVLGEGPSPPEPKQ